MQKETKGHSKNDEHFATKGDLRDAEYRLNIAILSTNHEIRETELRLKAEIQKEIAPIHEKLAVLDDRTKTSFNISLVLLGAVLAPLAVSLFPTLSKLLS